jgi:hypothetical protein
MTQVLQLLVIAAGIVGVVIYGFIRDKQEHASKADSKPEPEPDPQQSIYFPEHDKDHEHRGAAMSHL